jgi:hypothetical protein
MDRELAKRLSVELQAIATLMEEWLQVITGQRCGFVLLFSIDDVTQYVANVERAEGVDLIRGLLERWEAGRADIPAHYNPDL